ncbi:MAG: glycosyltransferase family 39 protein [Crocinitomicaceae bacterium]
MRIIQFIQTSKYLTLLLLLILALVIKGIYIGQMGIGADEAFSVYTAQLSPLKIIQWLNTGDNPPLWELVMHYWIQGFGLSEISVRFPAYLFNVLTVIPIFLIGDRFVNRKAAVFASLLFIFSSLSLFLAHEARVYSLLGFLGALSVYSFLSAIKSPNMVKYLVILTICNGLILYSHYLGYWLVLVQMILFVGYKPIRQSLKFRYLVHLGLLFLVFSPLIPVIIDRFYVSGLNGTWVSKSEGIVDLYNMLWKFSNKPLATVLFIALFIASIFKRLTARHISQKSIPYINFIHCFVWLPLLASFLISFKIGFFLDRYFYFLLPFFYLSIAAVSSWLFSQYLKLNLAVHLILILVMIFSFNISTKDNKMSGFHQDTKSVAFEVAKYNKHEQTAIIICPDWYDKEVVYYLDRNLFSTYFNKYNERSVFKIPLNEQFIYPVNHFSEIELESSIKSIVFVDRAANFHSPENGVEAYLDKTYSYQEAYSIDGVTFRIFDNKNPSK